MKRVKSKLNTPSKQYYVSSNYFYGTHKRKCIYFKWEKYMIIKAMLNQHSHREMSYVPLKSPVHLVFITVNCLLHSCISFKSFLFIRANHLKFITSLIYVIYEWKDIHPINSRWPHHTKFSICTLSQMSCPYTSIHWMFPWHFYDMLYI